MCPKEVVRLANVQLSKFLEDDLHLRCAQMLSLMYSLEDLVTTRVDRLRSTKDSVCCWLASLEIRSIFDVVKHQRSGMKTVA
jgi:hypothetical protein